MNTYCLITQPINCDAQLILASIDKRSKEIKKINDSQSLVRRIAVFSLKIFGLAMGMVTLACLPVAAITFSVAPLTIAALSLTLSITCLALWTLFDVRSLGESIVKDYWKALFEAIREGHGEKILHTCADLAKQQELRPTSFSSCLGTLSFVETTPFLHKARLVGHLLIALNYLYKDEEEAKSSASKALSHFDSSGFSSEIKRYAKAIIDAPREVRRLIDSTTSPFNLYALDSLIRDYVLKQHHNSDGK